MFWDNYRVLCAKEKKTPNKVAAELGISSGTVTGWKNGAMPRKPVLEKICQHFGVSESAILGEYGVNDESLPSEINELTAAALELYQKKDGEECIRILAELAQKMLHSEKTSYQSK